MYKGKTNGFFLILHIFCTCILNMAIFYDILGHLGVCKQQVLMSALKQCINNFCVNCFLFLWCEMKEKFQPVLFFSFCRFQSPESKKRGKGRLRVKEPMSLVSGTVPVLCIHTARFFVQVSLPHT